MATCVKAKGRVGSDGLGHWCETHSLPLSVCPMGAAIPGPTETERKLATFVLQAIDALADLEAGAKLASFVVPDPQRRGLGGQFARLERLAGQLKAEGRHLLEDVGAGTDTHGDPDPFEQPHPRPWVGCANCGGSAQIHAESCR
jgi:hypothetical protein